MNNLGVDLAAYQGLDNGAYVGETSPEQLAELNKALEAGSQTGREVAGSTTSSGAPLKVESLDSTLKHLEFRESDIVLWKMINKSPAYNTVEEFNQLVSYGADRGGFNNEGELPVEEDSVYRRAAEHVKFMGVTKSVTHPMQLVRTQPAVSSIMQREVKNGTMWIMRKANRALAYGDSSLVPQEWNGLYAQHRNAAESLAVYMDQETVIDLRGKRLTEGVIEQGSEVIIENNGYADVLIAPPVVLSDFAKNFTALKTIYPNTPGTTAGVMGQRVKAVQTQFGEIGMKYDKFLKSGKPKLQSSAADSAKSPGAPTADPTTPVNAVTDGSTLYGDGAGDYYYALSAVNRYGESSLTILNPTTALSVAATQSVDLLFTDGGGAVPATAYTVYRSAKNDANAIGAVKFYPLYTVSRSNHIAGYDGGAANTIRDKNRRLGNCQEAMMLENNTEVYDFKQLAPLMKMDLAILGPATRFMVLLYGTPQLFAPGKMVRYINIGREAA